MEYINVVRSDFEEFAKENVEGYEHSKTLMMAEYVSNTDYPQIERVPFFSFEGNKLLFTYNQLEENRINKAVLKYAVNLCFNSDMSNKYGDMEALSNTYSAVYYCLLDNMYKTLKKKDIESVLYWLD
ncbi:TPA: hypothetical protein ACOEGS_004515 [Enterobacter hormaechei subsp. xiangfangensis]|uniref:hypothetical protein n=1 Tax=Enterobacteriaceae TaxID=543 RepID=UPI0010785DD9|nr:hypothetical protein [Escherichia coli]EAA7344617.1 hypothetical protein [Salmonella enterica]EBF9720624.1 hypothetical protein [Salmonella enterica subsp. enterica serovar Enteritidis]ECM3707944.1 hypothetical protein [Salmonella enterica subsp. enterica serovar Agona]EDW8179691.1 hypothetical protein [Salmonella enterica subsp. enterica serovar Mbandaka]MCJ5201016.1 hypothetical protein [Klebsiella pneumoniae]HBM3183540.1 hypothetical protein [Klebsiella oxytoca]HCR5855144.1 hypothetica